MPPSLSGYRLRRTVRIDLSTARKARIAKQRLQHRPAPDFVSQVTLLSLLQSEM